jgi:hypothetical protein
MELMLSHESNDRRLRYIAGMEVMKTKFLSGNLKGRSHLEETKAYMEG